MIIKLLVEGKVELFRKVLSLLSNVEIKQNREVRAEHKEEFYTYLIKDRSLMEELARNYLNYVKELKNWILNYDLYFKISHNKQIVKTIGHLHQLP